jgi:hypothetical protein
MLVDWIYNTSPLLSSGVFILGGIVASGLIVVVLARLVEIRTRHTHNEFISFTVTNIAVLYAVLLAFIAVAAWENLSKASDLVGIEAGLVGDLYVDAIGLSDKGLATSLRNELHRYLRGVVDQEWPEQQTGRVSKVASPPLRGFHEVLASLQPKTSGDAIVMQEMLHTLNELYNARRSRLEAAGGHIPNMVWWVIVFLGLLTVGFTALLGVHHQAMHFAMVAGLTTALVVVVALIVQLDYPFRGVISVSAEPFERVLSEIGVGESAHLRSGVAH